MYTRYLKQNSGFSKRANLGPGLVTWAFFVAQLVMQETWIQSLDWEDP